MSIAPHRWRSVGAPATDTEREALEHLRALLPDDPLCFAWSNLSVPDHLGLPTEIDLLLLNGAGLFVVELKGWNGEIAGKSYDWTVKTSGTARRRRSPVPATQNKARQMKSLLVELRDEHQVRTSLPYVTPVVVLHGRRSTTKLDDRARQSVYGLDGYDVKGVPCFSAFLREPPVRGARLDKAAVDAVARLLKVAGMEPLPYDEQEPPADAVIPDATPQSEDVQPDPLLAHLSDGELVQLGVPEDRIHRVRPVWDELEWIGIVEDSVFDNLMAVLDGAPVTEVVARRRESEAIFNGVAEQAAAVTEPDLAAQQASAAGQATGDAASEQNAPAAEDAHAPAEATHPVAEDVRPGVLAAEDVERLRQAFGDRVVVRTPRGRPASVAKPMDTRPNFAARVAPLHATAPEALRPEAGAIRSEHLLDVARVEALLGRTSAARFLLREVETHLDEAGIRDWSRSEVEELAMRLSAHPLLAQRLEVLSGEADDEGGSAPVIEAASVAEPGSHWTGPAVGRAYSLLLRVPDVLDRVSGVYLSQYVGEDCAATVNARLRQGRPDGGRVRITSDGTVVSRRDGSSPWFVVGAVRAEEWFPADGATPIDLASLREQQFA